MESVIVAVTLLAVIASVGIAAIIKYETVEDALKIWGALSGLMGVVTGVFVTYFFTHPQIVEAERKVAEAQVEITEATLSARVASKEIEDLWKNVDGLKSTFATLPDDAIWGSIKSDPKFVGFVNAEWEDLAKYWTTGLPDVNCEKQNGKFICTLPNDNKTP